MKKTISVPISDTLREICGAFDFNFSGESSFEIPDFQCPEDFGIGLIVGPSGSGKSSILETKFSKCESEHNWDERSIVDHFNDTTDAIDRLGAVGLNSIPSWARPFHVLSTGEKFRADIAKKLESGAIFEEFTSVVDRNVAKSCAVSISKYVKRKNLRNVVFATCHYDIIDWLEPDWIFDTGENRLKKSCSLDRQSRHNFYPVNRQRGNYSAIITICQQKSIKVRDAGSQYGMNSQLDLPLQ